MSSTVAEPARAGGTVRTHLRVPLYRNAYALVATTAVTSALGIVYWALAARRYAEVDVGRAGAAVAALLLLGGATQLNLTTVLPRFLPEAGPRSTRLVLTSYAATVAAAVVVGGVYVAVGGVDEAMAAGASPWPARLAFVAALVAWNLFTVQDAVLAGIRQAVWVPFENAIFAGAKIALLVVLAASMPRTGLFTSWSVPAAVLLVPVSVLLFGRLLPAHRHATAHRVAVPHREVIRYAAADYVGGLAQLSTINAMPLLVVWLVGLEANAYFATAWIAASAFDLALANIGVSFTVEGAHDGERMAHLTRSTARLVGAVSVVGGAAILVGAPWFLALLGPEYRAEGTIVLRLLAVAMPFRAVTTLYLSLARLRRRLGRLVAVQAATCAIALGAATVLLPRRGIEGAALGYLIAQVLVAVAVLPAVLADLRSDPGAGSEPGPTVSSPTDPIAAAPERADA